MKENKVSVILKEARKKQQLTHQKVVELSGASITPQYYGAIERGDRRPSPNVAKKIAPVLGLKWTIFFNEIENQ
ncbi:MULTISPECIES: helix-turn-helix transcriptional regulator [Bacillus]|uniref:helix-turn-helix transcriptional regulator n=1 Tax=Bacillus TaxID=1386 RepID=UPI0030FA3E0C